MGTESVFVYYSWVGSTKVVVSYMSELTGIQKVEISESKERPISHLAGAALGAFLGFKSKLNPMDFEMPHVKTMFLGAQVWAGKTPPAINTFLSKASFRGKDVWLIMTAGDDKTPIKVIDSIKRRIEKRGGSFKGHVSFQTFWDPQTNVPIAQEKIQEKAKLWLTEEGFLKPL